MPQSLFMPNDPSGQESDTHPRASTRIGDHLNERRFCAWALREKPGRGLTKVPFQARWSNGREVEAKSNEPATWLTAEQAVRVSKAINNGNANYLGIFLGVLDIIEGYRLGGLDLDTCVSPDGMITPWAREAMARLDTYGERSPSGTGLKVYFLYRTADTQAVLDMMGTDTGKQYKEYGKGGNHPPGIEFYIRKRFFAVTGDHHAPTPSTINAITLDDIEWLLRDLGPRVSGKPANTYVATQGGKPTQYPSTGGHDQSRSARAKNRAWQLRRIDGLETYDEIKDALLDDPDAGVRDWMHEKGLARAAGINEYEYNRIFEKSKPTTSQDRIRCSYARMQRNARLLGGDDDLLGFGPLRACKAS